MSDPAKIALAVGAVVTCVDKLIEIFYPNSKINSIFDMVVGTVYKAASALTEKKSQGR